MVLYIKTSISLWSYLSHFIEEDMFQTVVVVEKIKTYFVFNIDDTRADYEMCGKIW
jgi:hypothetical protein